MATDPKTAVAEEETAAERMFPNDRAVADQLKHDVAGAADQYRDQHGLTLPQAQARVNDQVKMLGNAVNPNDARRVFGLITSYTTKAATPEEVEGWGKEARKQIREVYGKHADALMKGANELVRKNPALAKVLTETGLGNHPKIIKALVDRVQLKKFGRRPL